METTESPELSVRINSRSKDGGQCTHAASGRLGGIEEKIESHGLLVMIKVGMLPLETRFRMMKMWSVAGKNPD